MVGHKLRVAVEEVAVVAVVTLAPLAAAMVILHQHLPLKVIMVVGVLVLELAVAVAALLKRVTPLVKMVAMELQTIL